MLDASAEDVVESAPYEWLDTTQSELPQKNDKDHSWISVDRHHPIDYWKRHWMTNEIKMVFGSTTQGDVTTDNYVLMNWSDTNAFQAHVESKLGSFNVSLPAAALDLYESLTIGSSDNWHKYSTMLTDIRTVCPLQKLAQVASVNSVANVYAYVVTQPRSGVLGGIADSTSDVSAIFGTYDPKTTDERAFVANIRDMFYGFVAGGTLPQNKDITLGMYTIDTTIRMQRDCPQCDFWENSDEIVPMYKRLD